MWPRNKWWLLLGSTKTIISSGNFTPVAPLTNFICNQIGKHVTICLYIANRKCPIWIGAQGQIEVLIENSSLRRDFVPSGFKNKSIFFNFISQNQVQKYIIFCLALLILGPNHISSITVQNAIFFRFCRHYFFVLRQMFWWWSWKYNWFWKLVAKDFENVIYQPSPVDYRIFAFDAAAGIPSYAMTSWK